MLVLIRHGESSANASGLLLGRSDVPLTERGHRQVEKLAARIGPASRLICSPLVRARQTAENLGLDLPVEIDDRWIELDYGELDGRSIREIPLEVFRQWRSDPGFRPRGGESLVELGFRVRAACRELVEGDDAPARDDAGDVVVVTHASPIKAAVAWTLGASDEMAWRLHIHTGSVSRINWSPAGPVLFTWNEVPT